MQGRSSALVSAFVIAFLITVPSFAQNREIMSRALSRAPWRSLDGLSDLDLRGDAVFHWTELPGGWCGTPNFIRTGKWNFRSLTSYSGLIFLTPGSVIPFRLSSSADGTTDSLLILSNTFVSNSSDSAAAGRPTPLTQFPEVKPIALYTAMTATPWCKTDDFGHFFRADSLRFFTDGTYVASYRGNRCRHGGHWGLIADSTYRGNTLTEVVGMWHQPDRNTCDLRGPGFAWSMASNEQPRVNDSTLYFYTSSYRPAARRDSVKTFSFDTYTGSIKTIGTYRGFLELGQSTTIQLNFKNMDSRLTRKLTGIRARLEKLQLNSDSFSHLGEPVILLDQYFDPPRDIDATPTEVSFTIIPAWTGFQEVTIEVDYFDERQEYRGREQLVFEIE